MRCLLRPPDMDYVSVTNFYDNFRLILDNIRSLPRKYNLVILGDNTDNGIMIMLEHILCI